MLIFCDPEMMSHIAGPSQIVVLAQIHVRRARCVRLSSGLLLGMFWTNMALGDMLGGKKFCEGFVTVAPETCRHALPGAILHLLAVLSLQHLSKLDWGFSPWNKVHRTLQCQKLRSDCRHTLDSHQREQLS